MSSIPAIIRNLIGISALTSVVVSAEPLDMIRFGDARSESSHDCVAQMSDIVPGGMGESSRRLLPSGERHWQGGRLKFVVRVDPERQNYFTVRLWGDDVNHNQMTLHLNGKQVGYRHLGDIETLEIGADAPAFPGRFIYRTCPLPLALTKGLERVTCEIRGSGPIWGYGKDFDQFQKPMNEPTRGLYAAYVHLDPSFVPTSDRKQGVLQEKLQVRSSPGEEVLVSLKGRVNSLVAGLIREPMKPCNQMQVLFLAKAFQTSWTDAFRNPRALEKIQTSLDAMYRAYAAHPELARAEPSTYNPEWFGLGPSGQVIFLLKRELEPGYDVEIDDGKGLSITRRQAYSQMLVDSRDWHREHRRQYTNQSMINDLYGIYLSNRGVAALDPARALPEAKTLRYLYESVGIEPWLGSEKDGKPTMPMGETFYQVTTKGLTRELGYVGNYGEVLDWVAQIYDATKMAPDEAGDLKIRQQLVKIARARAPFRYPMADGASHKAMLMETAVGWRDNHVPGNICYDQRFSHDGTPLQVAALTLDPELVGYAQQMLLDNQFFQLLASFMEEDNFRTTFALMAVPDRLAVIKEQPPSRHRLPMSDEQPDSVFSDEEDGVVAIKNGEEILYASLYWRARYAVNFLARVHHITPEFDKIATAAVEVTFTPSGLDYTRPDWTNFGFANGGPRYPKEFVSAHGGEKLPVARIPAGVVYERGKENFYAGRGDFYQLSYGRYLMVMNMSSDRTFEVKVPEGSGRIVELVTGRVVKPGSKQVVKPRSTQVMVSE